MIDDVVELRKRLLAIIKRCEVSILAFTKDMGIDRHTINDFMANKKKTQVKTLGKIRNFIEYMETEIAHKDGLH